MQATEHLPTTGTLLGIDPGGTGKGHTGIVYLWLGEDGRLPPVVLETWAVPGGLEGFREWAEHYYLLAGANTVVCETFVNRNIPGVDLTPVLIEGAVRYVRPDTILQPAAGKNTAVPDKVLDRLGLLDIGKSDHHRDRREAARHAIWYLKKVQHMPTLLHGWPRT